MHRLDAVRGRIDDRQAAVAEDGSKPVTQRRGEYPLRVRPAVGLAVAHHLDRGGCRLSPPAYVAGDAAHGVNRDSV